jgi:cytosine/adenosine deaminase-related metal-dependent hydrolase
MISVLLSAALSLAAPDTTEYVVLNHGRTAGAMRVVSAGDSVTVNFDYQDRQRGPHTQTRYHFAPDGSLRRVEVGGMNSGTVSGTPASEWFKVSGDSASWHTFADSGSTRTTGSPFYLLQTSTPYDDAMLARMLLHRPNHTATLLPVGTARAEVIADTTVLLNGAPQNVRMVAVDEGSFEPGVVWLDAADEIFASDAGWFITVRKGGESALPALRAIENRWHDRQTAALAARLAPAPATAVVIRNGDVFDSERGVVLPHTTVVIHGERIVAVGPDASVHAPRGATIVDATGKSVIPGLWDMHGHLFKGSELSNGVMQLASGVTTARDLASDIEDALSHRDRSDRGTLLAPRDVLAGFMEGPGLWAGPTATLVRTEEEARTWVARYDSMGYKQIKLYNLIHPDLVPAITEAAHKRGMRVSGHVPRGLTVPAAVTLGFDEINHIAFLVSTFFQDSLYLPKMRAYSQVAARVGPTFDPDAQRMTDLIDFLHAHNTVIDPTLGAFHSGTPLADGSDPVMGRTVAWLPKVIQRYYQHGAPDSPEDVSRARAGDATYARIVKRLYDAGVTIVPGTDNGSGLPLQGELEIYERAGIPASAVLQIATIVPARVMKQDKDYGSIAVGKVADLVIIDGKPAERISDVRRTVQVVRAGRVYRTKDLFAAANVTPQW